MNTYSAIPLNAEESALMLNGSCVGVLVHDESNVGPVRTSPAIHLLLRSLGGKLYFCGEAGPTLGGLARLVRDFENSLARTYEMAMAD